MKTSLVLSALVLAACGSAIGPSPCLDTACEDETLAIDDGGIETDAPGGCDSSAQCPMHLPVCDPVGDCRGCRTGAECDSGVCEPTGSCVPDVQIAHVASATGNDSPGCGAADSPCASIAQIVHRPGPPPEWIRIWPGEYPEPELFITSTVALSFDDGSSIHTPTGTSLVVGDGAELTVMGGAIFSASGSALSCSQARVHLVNLRLVAAEHAVYSWKCAIDIEGTELLDSDFGLEAHHSEVVLKRSRVARARRGTMLVYDSQLLAENNFLVDNEHAVDGFTIVLSSLRQASSFRFNTIAGNRVIGDTMFGVKCTSGAPVEAHANIVWNDNGRSTSGSGCDWSDSNLRSFDGQGDGVEPLFELAWPGDYRLLPSSPLIDATPSANVEVDHFGSVRPHGQGFDVGAHEHQAPAG